MRVHEFLIVQPHDFVFLCGHTHEPAAMVRGNAGAVRVGFDGAPMFTKNADRTGGSLEECCRVRNEIDARVREVPDELSLP